jgi:hypothetical protein
MLGYAGAFRGVLAAAIFATSMIFPALLAFLG